MYIMTAYKYIREVNNKEGIDLFSLKGNIDTRINKNELAINLSY